MILDEGLDEKIWELIETRRKQKDFGNARGVRNTFERVLVSQANRLATMEKLEKEDLMHLTEADVLELLPKAPEMPEAEMTAVETAQNEE